MSIKIRNTRLPNRARQGGYTLVEVMLAAALISAGTLIALGEKVSDFEQEKARALGIELFNYSNAIRQYVAYNPDTPATPPGTPLSGVGWLQGSDCPNGRGSASYLPCSFPEKLFGDVELNTIITRDDESGHINVEVETTPLKIGETIRPDLSGIAALVAKAGTFVAVDGNVQATYGEFNSNYETGIIRIEINNGIDGDIWVRVDDPLFRDSAKFHEDNDPSKRELLNVSSVKSKLAEILSVGVGSSSITLGSDTEITDNLKVAGTTHIDGDLTANSGFVISKASVVGNSCIMGSIGRDSIGNILSCQNDVWVGGGGGGEKGMYGFFGANACPDGWVEANGSNGTLDLRGQFVRALDRGKGVDPGRSVGTHQGDAIRNITGSVRHAKSWGGSTGGAFRSSGSHRAPYGDRSGNGATSTFDASRMVPTAHENRPVNIALLACMKK